MNVLIRRLGIVIKTIPIKGDLARVGSGEECEVCLSDPYLAPIVAELVRRNDDWYIVDSGSSLEGIKHGERRVVEEVLEPGEPYVVGGFEIVREEAVGESRRTRPGAPVAAAIPQTVFQARLDPLPGTVVQSLDEVRSSSPKSGDHAKPKLAFRPLATVAGEQKLPKREGAPRSRRRVILLAAAFLVAVLLLFAIIIGSASKETARPASEVAVATATVPTTASQSPLEVPSPPPQPTGDQAALSLDLESAFAGWEAELGKKEDPALRRKIVVGALEIGRAYAAVGDSRGKDYLERVVRYGDPQSLEVATARERLDIIRK